MKSMTKGAIVTGLGVALLLGGGGTLAVWNDAAESHAGNVVSGNLDLRADRGVWTKDGQAVDIATHRVVPGETLTYTQQLTPILVGEGLKATLALGGADGVLAHSAGNVTVTQPVLTLDGEVLSNDEVLTAADSGKTVTASTSFAFSVDTPGREDVNRTWNFSSIGYVLTQKAPTAG
ncbi:alternate-type signal peptide domain-containing protein [Citricoccus sp. SGAir0253]|uniref:alternate-type signal peptide domain-containing protein n=1 Tax=Citricoccus sp. SGAir0253 TaxID=2567881 RepID=UPI0011078679|nr:alternate-type signal peptide domain-containing protein [Citricoccus sp. SGAir0253]QCU76995.1 alternate-type signal peptide domain-containing protein [Citricoccus sp. SGAir0253]